MSLDLEKLDLATLSEACDLECKAAQGRDGRGELPDDLWKTYSAMADGEGGVIVLGVQERPPGQFKVLGLPGLERVRKALWDNLHNRKQIGSNLLGEGDVQPVLMDGHSVLRIRVPRAARQLRPVHLGANPFGGTYLRRHEGDYAADDETVRRMLAERVEDSRDERVLQGFDIADLDLDTVQAYGDHAGSGIPKIYRNWAGQHWRRPVLQQVEAPEQTLMELRMSSLLPPETVALLENQLGSRFTLLGPLERLAVVTAATEGQINHSRLRELSTEHSADITKMLGRLVREGLLGADGIGRGMVYFLSSQHFPRRDLVDLAGEAANDAPLSPEHLALTPELGGLTPELGGLTPELGRAVAAIPVFVELAQLGADLRAALEMIATPVSTKQRVAPELMRETVLALCTGHYLGLRVLAGMLNRRDQGGADLRKRILNPLVKEGLLLRAYPNPNDPRQAYLALPSAAKLPAEQTTPNRDQ